MSYLSKILNLEAKEEKRVVFLLIYSFFIGAALAFYVTSTTSLFLSVFERDFLPISFIAAGVLVWIVGKIMNVLFNNINFSKSLPLGLLFIFASVIVFLVLYKIWQWLAIVFLLYAWIRVFAYMHAVVFWSLAGRLFKLRAAKRIFSLITGGEVFASILSFFSIPILLKFLDTSDLLMISGTFLALAFGFMFVIVRNFKENLSFKREKKQKEKNTNIKLFSSKYFKLIFWIAFVPIFAQFFVDFIFQAQVKVEFPNRDELTAFVGVFFGVSAIIEFSLKTFVSGRILSKYGIKLGLLLFPLVLGISFFLASFFGLIYGTIGLFFSLVSLGRLFTRAVRTSFNDPSTQILYQPIPQEQRVIIQNKIESGPKAYASIVAGVFLFLFELIPNISLVVFSLILFIVTLIWGKLVFDIYKQYKVQIQKFLVESNPETKISKLKSLISTLKNIYKKDSSVFHENLPNTFFPYENMKEIDEEELKTGKISVIADLTNSEKTKDRVHAARQLPNFSIYKVEKLFLKLLNDKKYEVRNQAIISAGIMKEKELYDKIIDNFKTIKYRKPAINAILNIGSSIIPKIVTTFHSNEYNTDIQLEIIDVLSNIQSDRSIQFFRKIINYHVNIVREKSVAALAKLGYNPTRKEAATFTTVLEEEIRQFVFLLGVKVDLHKFGNTDFLNIELEKVLENKKAYIFNILSILYDSKSIELIRNNLSSDNEENRGFAIEIADTVLSESHKDNLLPLLENISVQDMLRRYKNEYPQENLSEYDRIIDIINVDLKTTGIFLKVEAIKKLTNYKSEKTIEILNSELVNPIQLIAETAAYTFYLIDEEAFEKNINIFRYRNDFLNDIYLKIKRKKTNNKLMIFEKIQLLSSLENFNQLSDPDLFLIAQNSEEIVILPDSKLKLGNYSQTDFFILVSGTLSQNSEIEINGGSIISDLFVDYKGITEFVAKDPTMLFKLPLYVFNVIADLNTEFAENILNKIIKQQKQQNINET